MIIIKLVYSLLIIFIAGKLLLDTNFFDISDEPPWVRMPLYFFAGTTVISLYMFLLSLIKIPFNVPAISLPFLIYAIYLIFRNKNWQLDPRRFISDIKNYRFSWPDILIGMLAIICASMLINSIIVPVFAKDAYSIWFFKAKIFFTERTVPFNILTSDTFEFSHSDYPFLISLNLAWISLCLGQWKDTILRIFFTAQYALFIPFFYFWIRKYISRRNAAIASFVLFSNSHLLEYGSNGYSDLILGIFVAVSIIFLMKWFDSREKRHLYLSSFFIGSSMFIKNDGTSLFLAASLILAAYLIDSYKNKRISLNDAVFDLCSFLGISLAIFMPFKTAILLQAIPNHMIKNINIFATIADNLYRIPIIAGYFLYELYLDTYSWQYFWIFLTILLIIGRKRIFGSNTRYIPYFFFISLSFYFIVYMLTVLPLAYHLEYSFHRLLIGLAPAAAFLAFSSGLMEET